MIYQHLYDRILDPETVRAALVGCGSFGGPIVTQARLIPRLEIRVVADTNIEAAHSVFLQAGAEESEIAVCDSRSVALRAMESGKWVITEDAMILMDLPVHVVVTATRTPEAGARYACEAIRHGKHVVLVDKEADSVVGPILKRMADRAGVVLTTDDGDQPGLLIGLASWARALGLEVLCGGHWHECFYQPEAGTLTIEGYPLATVSSEARWAINCIPDGESQRYASTRRQLTDLWRPLEEDGDTFAHMAVTANGTGLMPDTPVCHRPLLRLSELPEALCPTSDGGILSIRGAVELPTLLRTGEATGVDGGVFIIVSNADELSRRIMAEKGLLANRSRSAMLIYRPHHICGAETAISILTAGLLQVPTGASEIIPRVDIAATATRNFKAGEILSAPGRSGNDSTLRASLLPASPLADDRPLPFFMLESNRLALDVPAGALITRRMVVPPSDSYLWDLRQQQDKVFLPEP